MDTSKNQPAPLSPVSGFLLSVYKNATGIPGKSTLMVTVVVVASYKMGSNGDVNRTWKWLKTRHENEY